MKLLTKIAATLVVAGVGATMYAAPNDASGDASLESMLSRTELLKSEMAADYRHVVELQLVARKEKDIIKLNCINDKLVAMKPQMNILEHIQSELVAARTSQEQKIAFDGLVSAGAEVKGLREAADQCIGQHLLLTESSNEYTHPDIPDNPSDNPFSGATIEPPAYASPVN